MQTELTPEAAEALAQVYAFLLRRRRERLACQAQITADAGSRPGASASAAEQSPEMETTIEVVLSTSNLSTEGSCCHE